MMRILTETLRSYCLCEFVEVVNIGQLPRNIFWAQRICTDVLTLGILSVNLWQMLATVRSTCLTITPSRTRGVVAAHLVSFLFADLSPLFFFLCGPGGRTLFASGPSLTATFSAERTFESFCYSVLANSTMWDFLIMLPDSLSSSPGVRPFSAPIFFIVFCLTSWPFCVFFGKVRNSGGIGFNTRLHVLNVSLMSVDAFLHRTDTLILTFFISAKEFH